MTDRLCEIEGCTYKYRSAGMCEQHYRRHRRGRDMTKPATNYGKTIAWLRATLEELALNPTSYCVLHGFGGKDAYGRVTLNGRTTRVHHAVLVLTGRALPANRHQHARHLCGNKSCVNPRHIEVGSVSQNMLDKIEHGTATRGERNPSAKLTESDVLEIRSSDLSHSALAPKYGVTPGAIRDVRIRRNWKHL